jgi:hypothetical protein
MIDLVVELTELLIGFRSGPLHRCKRNHEVTVPRDGYAADRKVLQRAQRVNAVLDVGRDLAIAEQIVLDAHAKRHLSG